MQRPTLEILTGPQRAGAMRLLESTGLPSSDLTDEMLEHFFFVGPSSAQLARDPHCWITLKTIRGPRVCAACSC